MDTKSLSSRQVHWAQELSRYYFQINYCQSKANGAIDTLSRYPQWSAEKEKTFQAKNIKILHRLQAFLTNTSLSGFSTLAKLLPFHQVIICKTYVLPQLWQFWSNIQSKIALDGSYANIRGMRLRLPKLQDNDKKAEVLRAEGLPEG